MFHTGESEPYGRIHFLRNGTSEFTPANGGYNPESAPWRAGENSLVMSSRERVMDVTENRVILRAASLIESWTGYTPTYVREFAPLEIISVATNEILLQGPRKEHRLTFRRIPE